MLAAEPAMSQIRLKKKRLQPLFDPYENGSVYDQWRSAPDILDPLPEDEQSYDTAQDPLDYGAEPPPAVIPPSRAVRIAMSVVPGAKPVGVRLLPRGVYAVTLRANGRVEKIFVDAETGDIR
jgi:hypothetical protein